MKRYTLMYAAWLAGVLAMATAAVAWYRYVEGVGREELAARLRAREAATDDTEATDVTPGWFSRPTTLDEEPAA